MNDIIQQETVCKDKNNWSYHRISDGLEFTPHWHTHYETLMIYQGDVRVVACGKCIPVEPPCAILYRPFTLHGMANPPETVYERSMVNFTINDVALFSDKLFSMSFLNDLPFLIIPLTEQQVSELEVFYKAIHVNLWDFAENRLYIALIVHYLRRIAEKQGLLQSHTVKRQYISNVLQYLAENLSEPLRLETTAEHFGVSRTKMNKDLYSVTGMTFKDYLTELRMTKAKGLMEDGSSVAQAAQECGYNSESNFIAVYRRRWGCTPAQTKKQGTE